MTSGHCSRYIGNTLVLQFEHEIFIHVTALVASQLALLKCTKTQSYAFDLCSLRDNKPLVKLQKRLSANAYVLCCSNVSSPPEPQKNLYNLVSIALNKKKRRSVTSGLNWMCKIAGVSTQRVKLGNQGHVCAAGLGSEVREGKQNNQPAPAAAARGVLMEERGERKGWRTQGLLGCVRDGGTNNVTLKEKAKRKPNNTATTATPCQHPTNSRCHTHRGAPK